MALVCCDRSSAQACGERTTTRALGAHHEVMITVECLSKRFGRTVAVDSLSFTVRPGVVTGFLGPNGAGKSTTMRMISGLTRPNSGRAMVNGRALKDHVAPLAEIGMLLDAAAVHPKRSARNHLRVIASTNGIPLSRVDDLIGLVGLEDVADRSSGDFSLGMGQRLGIATALLGDPETIMLDEPLNGLDPEGIVWIRTMLKGFASEGRTVFVSSHLMSEMALMAEHFLIVGAGRLLADTTAVALKSMAAEPSVRVRTLDAERLRDLLAADGVRIVSNGPTVITVIGRTSGEIGAKAATAGIALDELVPEQTSLEQVFMALTHDSAQYRAHMHQGSLE